MLFYRDINGTCNQIQILNIINVIFKTRLSNPPAMELLTKKYQKNWENTKFLSVPYT